MGMNRLVGRYHARPRRAEGGYVVSSASRRRETLPIVVFPGGSIIIIEIDDIEVGVQAERIIPRVRIIRPASFPIINHRGGI